MFQLLPWMVEQQRQSVSVSDAMKGSVALVMAFAVTQLHVPSGI
jgi:hypothetical protein